MTAKMSEKRRAAFLKALTQSGNVSLSAERTNVSRSWVLAQRKCDPAFDEACRAAVEAYRSAEDAPGSNKPPSGWGHLDGVQLVVRGSGGAGPGRRVQVARARVGQWSPQVEERFLSVLAATCNVKASYEAVGMSKGSAYMHRRRWTGFAERWDSAVEAGYARLELGLLERGANLFSEDALPEAAAVGAMSVVEAIHLLHMHKHQVKGIGGRPGPPPGKASPEELNRALAKGLRALRAERGRGAGAVGTASAVERSS